MSGDSFYIDFDGDAIVDDGLSRFPDLNNHSVSIEKAFETSIKLHRAGGMNLSKHAYFSSCSSDFKPCYKVPPHCRDIKSGCTKWDEMLEIISTSDYIFFAGHGSLTGSYTNNYIRIFASDDIGLVDLNDHNPVVIGYYSCNSGRLSKRPSLATEFMGAGASHFIARTETLGVPTTVAENFPQRLQSGERIDDALFSELRASSLAKCSFTESNAAIVLYGDPTLRRK